MHLQLLAALGFLCSSICCLGQFPEQKAHRQNFQQVSDQVYQTLRYFYDYDAHYPLNIRVLETWEDEKSRWQKIAFNSAYGGRIPGELALPLDSLGPVPAVILVHGLGSSKERWYRDDRTPLVDSLLAAGIAVFTLDLNMHGERSYLNDFQNPVFLTLGDSLQVINRNMFIRSAIDVRRALDLLRSRGDIKPQSIALVGYSMGAMITSILIALEPDLAAAVMCALPTTEQPPMIDPYIFAARAHLPAQLLIGKDDWLSSPQDIERLKNILPVGSEVIFFDSGHRLPAAFTSNAFKWLQKQLH